MNSGHTAERVYDAIKRRVRERGFRPGDRLDPAALASDLSASVTPVRDALHLLTGEGLIATRTSDGFHVPPLDEPALQDLYRWNADVLILALKQGARTRDPAGMDGSRPNAEKAARLFDQIATASQNVEHRRAMWSLNDRLWAVRLAEDQVLGDATGDTDQLIDLAGTDDRGALRRAILRYHSIRVRHAAEIVRALYRTTL